jgi:hypothetical protein
VAVAQATIRAAVLRGDHGALRAALAVYEDLHSELSGR